MLNRREFLRASACVASTATVTLLLAPLGCSSSNDSGVATATGTTLPGCDGAGSTSSVNVGHTHDLCVPLRDLTSPPAAGAAFTTTPSTTDGHTHAVGLSQPQLAAIANGQSVMVSTSTTDGHVHTFSITRELAARPPQSGFGY